jgi:alpha-1,6-mannosyltransferase
MVHLVDTTIFFTPQGGGVPRYLRAKHEWLKRHSAIRHTIVAPGLGDGQGDVATVKTWPLLASYGYRFPIHVTRWRNRLVQLNPDLIEVGDPYGPAWAALRAGQIAGVPVVGFYHSDLVRLVASRFGARGETLAARYIRQLYRQFDLVLAPSRYVAGRLADIGVDGVVRQPLGVDTELFHPKRRDASLRRELGLAQDTRLLVFAGRFSNEKNVPLLLKAFSRLGSGYHLLLVGGGMTVPAQPNVTVMGYQCDERELARLLASCDALVHAGQQETFGLVALEAMACGIPVVGVAEGGVAELVGDRYGVLARPGSSSSFAEAIESLYEREPRVLGARAREAVIKNYGWDEVMRSILAVYRHRVLCSWSAAVREVYACR